MSRPHHSYPVPLHLQNGKLHFTPETQNGSFVPDTELTLDDIEFRDSVLNRGGHMSLGSILRELRYQIDSLKVELAAEKQKVQTVAQGQLTLAEAFQKYEKGQISYARFVQSLQESAELKL